MPFETGVAFAELDSETAKEHAERTGLEAERDLKWAQTGAIDGTDIRQRLINDKDSGYTGIEAAEPDGPAPRSVVQPGAPSTAPNTPPGSVPSSAPATVAATTPAPSNAQAGSAATDGIDDAALKLAAALLGLVDGSGKWHFFLVSRLQRGARNRVGQGEGPRWGWNMSVEAPTFTPSVLVRSGHFVKDKDSAESRPCWCDYNKEDGVEGKSPFVCTVCHSFVTNGNILFLGDCTHAMAGQTVPLPDWPDNAHA